MFKYLRHTEIDKTRWDLGIKRSVNANIYGFSWFLDAVCPGWTAIVDDEYSVLLPLPTRKKFGLHYIFQPFFTQQLGPFYSDNGENESSVLKYIPSFYRYIELKLSKDFKNEKELLGYDKHTNSNYKLRLNKKYEELFKSYAYNTRRNVKKCSLSLKIVNEFDDSEAIRMFVENKGAKLKNYKKEYHEVLVKIVCALASLGRLEKWAVLNDKNELMAAAHFAVHENTKVFLFSSTDERGKSERAMFYLLDRFICQHAETSFVLDFSGSNDPHLGRFYSGFGAEKESYLRIVKNDLPFYMRWLKR